MRREIALNEIECGGALDAQEAVFVSRLQANEDAAYDELVRVYHASIFHVAYRMLGDSNDASDAVQEIFLKVFRNVQRFRGESSLKTWIYRIASNHCLRQIAKEKRYPKSELPVNLGEDKPQNIEPEIQFLYKCVAELPETDRIIISLELEDVKQAEIAAIVGLSESNVRVRIHRIKEKLTQKFKSHGR